MNRNAQTGAHGEQLVHDWYMDHGYIVLDRNWRPDRMGELDLVVTDGTLTVAVEVKSRSSSAFGHPLEAVTEAKARRVRLLAYRWLAAHPDAPQHLRVDIATVLAGHVEIHPDLA
jgi:putative endonuclease